ncbi:MAG: 4Fe-4S binding protein, partial [Anaerolineae bacterium]
CLNARFRGVDCSLCADACPAKGAIGVTNGKPILDNGACLHCGLCLHICPTEAYTRPDGLAGRLVKLVAALPAGPVDLLCPQHPRPDAGAAPQAVQTRRCLAALAPATLLEVAATGREIRLDDTPCPDCPLGNIHPALQKTAAEANAWAGLLAHAPPVALRSGPDDDTPPAAARPVYDVDQPPLSRRSWLGSLKKMGEEVSAAEEAVAMVKAGKSVPVAERLPQSLPHQRARILSILKKSSLNQSPVSQSPVSQSPITNDQLPTAGLPISTLNVDPARCTACGLCARFCPTGALRFLSDGEAFALTFQPLFCLGQACDICVPACPEQAVSASAATVTADLPAKKTLAAGNVRPCRQCGQPVAAGPELPATCFACRPKAAASDLFGWKK